MPGRWKMLGTFTLCVLLFFANTRLDAALPDFPLDAPMDSALISWPIYAYALAFAGVLIPVKACPKVLAYGLAGFGLASLLCAFASDLLAGGLLIGGRAVQGLSAAIVVRAGYGLVTAAFPARAWQAAAVPTAAILVGVGLGPVLIAAVDDLFSYADGQPGGVGVQVQLPQAAQAEDVAAAADPV
ncbi:hypothetical protein AB0K48_36300, partial [Nonomuraea sp. NPDC055795]